jgi:hypothetical protein
VLVAGVVVTRLAVIVVASMLVVAVIVAVVVFTSLGVRFVVGMSGVVVLEGHERSFVGTHCRLIGSWSADTCQIVTQRG